MESAKQTVQPQKEALLNRLKRIEGQVRGIQNMIQADKYCIDILHQTSAIEAAMKKVSLTLMEDHTKHCIHKAIKHGDDKRAIDELMEIIQKMAK
ncbi:DNA-binding FrmR family transcriptional regulator [Alkalihalobacillus xiaoxiensis]|uniref:DNA-binding FrmR family transcriptional regulator n=1 Tax=Shouchella xiaoxiensis TaxID=766895 RepID=A0ABS2SX44_9BACI|nr:metal-sensitive transcriptional regulator [Shouchella xiaoxiensis]MBM7839761.1 DNA-binding FrmR family transcriptional regulator [Shouchella xiaoxiensis]